MKRTGVLFAIGVACGQAPSSPGDPLDTDAVAEWEPMEILDQGEVCFGDIAVDTPSSLQIDLRACLSSSCTRDRVGTCTATTSDSDITLASRFTWDEAVSGVACTEDCRNIVATCTLEGLPAGDYVVTHGDQTLSLTLPRTEDCGA